MQLLALEGATPMWPKFQHFAVDIPGHHREAERVRWALHIYTALLVRLTTYRATVVSLGYRLVNVLYRTLIHSITLIFLHETHAASALTPRLRLARAGGASDTSHCAAA